MDPTLHQKQGINHLNRVLEYAPMVAQNGHATVHLTAEDWHVVADTLFQMHTPDELLPDAIRSYQLADDSRIIHLVTDDYTIDIEIL